MNDLIDRQAALDIYDDYNVAVENGELEAYWKHRKRLLELPSAQPVAKDINVPAKDCISRQDAIEAMAELQGKAASKSELIGISKAWKRIKALPSASPEQTDCEYCHEDSDGYVRSIEKNSHAWLVRRGRTMKLRVGFNGGYSECDILFCPMCGRRLTYG